MSNLMSEKEVASFLGLKPQTLAIWRMRKEKIPFVRMGRRIAYRREDVERWLESQIVRVGGAER